jgi:hypothetical protein
MAPLQSGGRKRKRGRREWDEGGSTSAARGVHEPTFPAGQSQREETHGPGTHLVLCLI